MSLTLLASMPTFAPTFFRALSTNLSVAANALAIGLPAGLLLGMLCVPAATASPSLPRQVTARAASFTVALLRAAPAFVVMYVLLHALPQRWAVSPEGAVALALGAYAAAYVADTLQPAVLDWRAGEHAGALLFITGVVRAYFVMVVSSGFGAAVGVTEATAVTLRALEQLSSTADRLGLMASVVLVFIALRQSVNAGIGVLQRWLMPRMHRHKAGP